MSKEAGKGSRQRPTDYQKYSENYDRIFRKNNTGVNKNEYYDILSTEDCINTEEEK